MERVNHSKQQFCNSYGLKVKKVVDVAILCSEGGTECFSSEEKLVWPVGSKGKKGIFVLQSKGNPWNSTH